MIEFVKMNGNGNNFLILENFSEEYKDDFLSTLAVKVCNSKTSIGADGILVIEKSDRADFKMRLFNSNGLEGEMCGNGARCVAKYAHYKGFGKERMMFETLAGMIKGDILEDEVRVSMGRVDISDIKLDKIINFEDRTIKYSYLLVGVPHCVILCDINNINTIEDMDSIGRYMDNNGQIFPCGTNVNFFKVIDKNTISVITYERGVEGITESCGTGSCASAIVASFLNDMSSPILVKNLGGDNKVWFEFDSDYKYCDIQLQGKVEFCAQIKMYDI